MQKELPYLKILPQEFTVLALQRLVIKSKQLLYIIFRKQIKQVLAYSLPIKYCRL